jgi:ribonuclease P protein component
VKRGFRLTRSTDIKRVRRGRSFAHPLVVLVIAPNEIGRTRMGVVAGHRVGGAVQRNRAKRRIRAVLHELHPSVRPGYDMVLIARQPMVEAAFQEVRDVLTGLLQRAGLLVWDGTDRG